MGCDPPLALLESSFSSAAKRNGTSFVLCPWRGWWGLCLQVHGGLRAARHPWHAGPRRQRHRHRGPGVEAGQGDLRNDATAVRRLGMWWGRRLLAFNIKYPSMRCFHDVLIMIYHISSNIIVSMVGEWVDYRIGVCVSTCGRSCQGQSRSVGA